MCARLRWALAGSRLEIRAYWGRGDAGSFTLAMRQQLAAALAKEVVDVDASEVVVTVLPSVPIVVRAEACLPDAAANDAAIAALRKAFATAEAAREAMKQLRENADNLALTIRGVYIPLNAAVSITSFLNMGSKLRVSMVCRDMHAIISSPHAWRSLEFPSWGRTRFNKASFNAVIVKPCFANVVHLTLGNMTLNKSLFPTVFSKLPLLYSLDMWSLSGTILQDTASDIVKAMKNPLGIQRLRLNCK